MIKRPLARLLVSRVAGDGLEVRPSRRRKRIALAIAAAADLLQLAVAPLFGAGVLSPFDDLLDAAVVLALVLTLGWRWRTLVALGAELVPGLALFPSWTAVVLTLPAAAKTVEPPALPAKI
jgi:hypothetical protein